MKIKTSNIYALRVHLLTYERGANLFFVAFFPRRFFLIKRGETRRIEDNASRGRNHEGTSRKRRLSIIQGIRGTKGPLSARFAHLTTGS